MRLLIKEIEPTYGSIAVAGRDIGEITRRKIPYYRRNLGVVFQDFKLLPNRTVYDNVAYALQVTGGSRREVREKVPDILRLTGLAHEAAQLPRPALGRRAAARLRGARVRQPSAAAAGRRADRQPRSRDLGRASCSCSTGSTAPARRSWWPRTTTRWSTDAPARDRGRAGPDRARREGRRATPARCRRAEFERAAGSDARDEARLLPARGAARAAPQRRPVLRRDGHRARHGAGARRLHPRGRGHDDRRRTRSAAKVLADVYLKPDATDTDIARVKRIIEAETPGVGRVVSSSPSRGPTPRSASATPRPTTCWARTRCPTPSA